MSVISEHTTEFSGRFYKISRISYSGIATTFVVDQSASSASAIEPASNAPTVTLGAADGNFERTVTLAAGGASGPVTVITTHNGTPAGPKPSARV